MGAARRSGPRSPGTGFVCDPNEACGADACLARPHATSLNWATSENPPSLDYEYSHLAEWLIYLETP
jgi:hypothetical protein